MGPLTELGKRLLPVRRRRDGRASAFGGRRGRPRCCSDPYLAGVTVPRRCHCDSQIRGGMGHVRTAG